MHYNQPYCCNTPSSLNNGYGNGYNAYNPTQINSSFYPYSIVGEGDVNCVTLPDGTCQFYFTPTANWWCSNAYYNMINSNNVNTCSNPNTGTWFVRSITSPVPAVWNNPLYQRHEAPIALQSSDCNRNAIDNGYQLKFHSDVRTSTTDIHYFYPCLRQIDYTLAIPTRGCAAVQVDTPIATNTTCHYEVVCPKPCNAGTTRVNTSVSAMSLDTNTAPTEVVTCRCISPLQLQRGSANKSLQRLQLLPSDARKKRIKLERKKQKIDEIKTRNVICECRPPMSVDKSVHKAFTTSGGNLNKGVQFSRCWCKDAPVQRDSYAKQDAEIWHPATDSVKSAFKYECPSRSSGKIGQNVIKSKSKDEICPCSATQSSERIKENENVRKSKSKEVICQCSSTLSSERVTQNIILSNSKDVLCQCSPTHSSEGKRQNVNKSKSKDVICQCDSAPSSDKLKAPQDACEASCCDLNKRSPSLRCCGKKVTVIKGDAFLKPEPEVWCPITDSLKKIFQCGRGASSRCSGCCN
ncbi:unnamed protein product [Arctia plantaginis]|uniref:Uncharacterized protein n=1 Tax=Arctia plantaginis TaxID=874455 RepID=A0A8S1ADL9_ARCPL|nr:unnamed protein product [Arctia plantaginis]CAB3253600.1 unnamed protein product [Arctia plantaginis]